MRKNFYVPHYFSVVKKVLKLCTSCRRVNKNPIKVNQNEYRDFRCSPNKTVFRSVFLDYIGPVSVRFENVTKKVWLLTITCLWSRAVSIQICRDATAAEFLQALQLHIFNHGMFEKCVSDLGSTIQAGANVLKTFLSDAETDSFFESNGITKLSFDHYAKKACF